MNHEDAFLQSILDDPDDDAPRLIFADWLEENGDPQRAQFIRAQCQLAELREDGPERYRLQFDETTLLPEMTQRLTDRKHPRSAGKLAGWLKDQHPGFHRGFVASLSTTPTRFLAQADNVMKAAPIQHLAITNARYKFDELLASPHLARLRSLTMAHDRLGDDAVLSLVALPTLSGLTALDLTHNRFRIEGAAAVAGSSRLSKLERLVLSSNRIHDRGPEAVASSEYLSGLKRLELNDCQIGPRGAAALAKSGRLGRLEWLDLRSNRLTDAGARSLADATGLANLTHLDVRRNQLGADAMRALIQNVGLKRLTTLSLTVNGGDEATGFWSMAPSRHLHGRLELWPEFWDQVRTKAWRDSALLVGCAGLGFERGRLGATAGADLAAAPAAAGLKTLALHACDLNDKDLIALSGSPHLQSLTRLSLAYNRFTKAGVIELVKSALFRRLTHLDLSGGMIGDDALKALHGAEGLERLERLRLARTPGQSRWRGALRERLGWRVVFE